MSFLAAKQSKNAGITSTLAVSSFFWPENTRVTDVHNFDSQDGTSVASCGKSQNVATGLTR